MKTNLLLTTSISIKASRAKVWDALVNPEQIKKYFFGTEAISDWKVGSPLLFKGIWEGKEYLDKGFILELVKESYFKYSYWSSFSGTEDLPENYATISYALSEDQSDNILLSIEQDGLKSEEQLAHSEANWKAVLDSLKKMLDE